jgi:hypothetical protein
MYTDRVKEQDHVCSVKKEDHICIQEKEEDHEYRVENLIYKDNFSLQFLIFDV